MLTGNASRGCLFFSISPACCWRPRHARNNSYGFTYDTLGRRTARINPDASIESCGYDEAGNLTTSTTRAGQMKTTVYDNRNRASSYTWSDATPGATMTYDAAGRLLTLNNGVSALGYSYDDANQLISETQAVSGQPSAVSVGYTYDADGNRASVTYPGGTVVSYAYTGRNELASVSAASYPSPLASYQYDGAGNRISKTLANGVTTTYERDDASQVTAVNSQLSAISYGYNTVGNRDLRMQTDAGQTARVDGYAYDATAQLTAVNYNNYERTVSYVYDAVGNRTAVTEEVNGETQNVPYEANNLNQYLSVGDAGPTYDTNGNLGEHAGSTYIYDAQNRLLSASSAASFTYDARNRCVSRTIGVVTTFFYYDGWNLIEEHDAGGNLIAKYIHGAQVDEILCRITPELQNPNTPSLLYYAHDALGSVTHLSDGNGNLVESYTYDVFGEPAVYDNSAIRIPQSAFGNRFMFTGREWIAEIDLYDYRNRVYSPTLGRFLQTDPIRFDAGDVNMYRYVRNAPATYADPMGLWYGPAHGGMVVKAMDSVGGFSCQDKILAGYANRNVDRKTNFFNGVDHYEPGKEKEAEALINLLLEKAVQAEISGKHNEAMILLGEGSHTVEDRFAHAEQGAGILEHVTGDPDHSGWHASEYEKAQQATNDYFKKFRDEVQMRKPPKVVL